MAAHRDTLQKEQVNLLAHSIGSGATDHQVVDIDGYRLELTHLNKRLWVIQDEHTSPQILTKRKLLQYYASIALHILPHLADRPLTIKRLPDGLEGQSFIQRHLDDPPEYIQTVEMYADATGQNQHFFVCQNLASLIYLANLDAIELHPWYSRINPEATKLPTIFINSTGTLELSVANYPDVMVFDLDPSTEVGSEAGQLLSPFHQAKQAAELLREVLVSYQLDAFIKTSGQDGLHVVVPIIRQYPYDQVREAARRIGLYLTETYDKIFTTEWQMPKRQGRVFIDLSQNARSKSLIGAYSLRSNQQATISMPITWEELATVEPTDFSLNSMVGFDSLVQEQAVLEVGVTTSGEAVEAPMPSASKAQSTESKVSKRLSRQAAAKPMVLPKDPWRDILKHAQELPDALLKDQ